VPEAEIVATLIEEANRIADEMGPTPLGTAQVVTV
jgi:(E)-4-hydroxy-3-methylbut-2-enyl-diphosphate synthase